MSSIPPDLVAAAPPPDASRRKVRVAPSTIVAGVVLVVIVLAALFPDLLATHEPNATALPEAKLGPGAEHFFGTDQLGRDVYSRIVYGSRISLMFGFVATAIAIALGALVGLVSGLAPRFVDNVIMRFLEIMLAFPELLVALVVVALLGPGTANVIIAVTVAALPTYARIVRISTIQVRQSQFVEAATALGQRRSAIVLRHVLPNVVGPLLVLATIGVGTAIIAGSSLSFLGLGPVPPSPEWGLSLSTGRDLLGSAWWVAVFPGLAITATVISTTVIGRKLQRRFEGRSI